jgi:hypothetical protein
MSLPTEIVKNLGVKIIAALTRHKSLVECPKVTSYLLVLIYPQELQLSGVDGVDLAIYPTAVYPWLAPTLDA